MANEHKFLKKDNEKGWGVRNTLSVIAAVIGLLSFLFLMTKGVNYTNPNFTPYYSDKELHMGALIFGNGKFKGLNPGLFSAFLLMCLGILGAILMNWSYIPGYLSFLFFIVSGILWFCAVPLYGITGSSLAVGGWCLGIFNIIDAILVFIGVAY